MINEVLKENVTLEDVKQANPNLSETDQKLLFLAHDYDKNYIDFHTNFRALKAEFNGEADEPGDNLYYSKKLKERLAKIA